MSGIDIRTTLAEASDKIANAVRNVGQNISKISSGDVHYFESSAKVDDLKKLLESDDDKEKLDGMKQAISMISKGKDAAPLFPSVVKNVITKNIELKKLVYMYLVHYAEKEQDNVLLAINTFQKDLGNSNHFIRACALRVLSSIRVKIILQIVVMSIQKAVKDTSPYVRKTVAHAVSKVYSLDRDLKNDLIEVVKVLLSDRNTLVLGSAVNAFNEICPDQFDLLHPHFRKLARMLPDIDEWGQMIVANVLLRYARTQFEDPNKQKPKKTPSEKKAAPKKKKAPKKKRDWDLSESEEGEDEEEEDEEGSSDDEFGSVDVDPDLRLLLDSCHLLLRSRNSGVVMSVATIFYYLAPESELSKVGKSLVRLLRSHKEIEYVVLCNLVAMAKTRPALFEPHLNEFFIHATEPRYVRQLKLEIITYLANSENISRVLKELKSYVSYEDKTFVAAAIQAIGRCAQSVPEITDRCLQGLLNFVTSPSEIVVSESIVVMKKLIQRLAFLAKPADAAKKEIVGEEPEEEPSDSDAAQNFKLTGEEDRQRAEETIQDVISALAKLLLDGALSTASAKANVVWLVGEYADKVRLLAPDVLRLLVKSFPQEDPQVKVQIINLGAKLVLQNPDQTRKLFEYLLGVAKYDSNYDVRDKTRTVKRLLSLSALQPQSPLAQPQVLQRLILTAKPVPTDINPSEGRLRFTLGTLSLVLNHTVNGYVPLPDFPEQAPPRSVRDEQILANISDQPKKGKAGKSEFESFLNPEEEGEEEGEEEEEEGSEEEEEGEMNEEDEEGSEGTSEEEEITPQPKKKSQPSSNGLEDLFFADVVPIKSSTKEEEPEPEKNDLDDFFAADSPTTNGEGKLTETSGSILSQEGFFIEYSYPSDVAEGASVPVLLTLKNERTEPVQKIRVADNSDRVAPFEEISELNSGDTLQVTLNIKFTAEAEKFNILTSTSSYPVILNPPN